jgi:hypothetical protein
VTSSTIGTHNNTTSAITSTQSGPGATATNSLIVTAAAAAGYGSTPAPGSVINVGTTAVNSLVTTALTVFETGSANLTVGLAAAPTGDFAIISGAPPFTIVNGGAPMTVIIRCIPSAQGARNASMTFTTNDPARPTVTYLLTCTGLAQAVIPTATPFGFVPSPVPPTVTPVPPTTATLFWVRGLAGRTGPYLGATFVTTLRRDIAYPVLAQNHDEGLYTWYLLRATRADGTTVDVWSSGAISTFTATEHPDGGTHRHD